jgi:hypothetical protein
MSQMSMPLVKSIESALDDAIAVNSQTNTAINVRNLEMADVLASCYTRKVDILINLGSSSIVNAEDDKHLLAAVIEEIESNLDHEKLCNLETIYDALLFVVQQSGEYKASLGIEAAVSVFVDLDSALTAGNNNSLLTIIKLLIDAQNSIDELDSVQLVFIGGDISLIAQKAAYESRSAEYCQRYDFAADFPTLNIYELGLMPVEPVEPMSNY